MKTAIYLHLPHDDLAVTAAAKSRRGIHWLELSVDDVCVTIFLREDQMQRAHVAAEAFLDIFASETCEEADAA